MPTQLRRKIANLAIAIAIVAVASAPFRPAMAQPVAGETDAPMVGEEAEQSPDEVGHETIVIVGRRVPEPLSLASRSVSVVDAQALRERPPRTVPEALWDAPGVFVQQTNYGGGSPIVRGLIGPQNLILVDGVRLNNSVYRTGPLQYLNLLDPQSIDRIEVLRGAGSVLYGSDAMGGVIQVIPVAARDCRGKVAADGGGRAFLRYSSADQGRIAHLQVDGGRGPVAGLVGVTYKDFFDLSGGRGIGEQVYSGYEDYSAVANLAYRFAAGKLAEGKLTAHYLSSRISDAGRTDKLVDKHSLSIYDNEDHLAYARLHLGVDRLRTTGDLTLSYQYFFERKDSFAVADDLATRESGTRDETFVDTAGTDLQLVTSLIPERMWLQYGGMWYRDWVDAGRTTWAAGGSWQPTLASSYPSGSSFANYGGFLLLEGDAVRVADQHTLRLGGGYRLHGMVGHAPSQNALPEVDFDHRGHVFFASAQYLHGADQSLALTLAQGFRAPNLNEAVMLGDTGKYFHIPNPDLAPERSDTAELAGRVRVGPMTAGLAGYVSLLHDLIKREETSWEGESEIGDKPVVWNVNGDAGILWGVEPRLDLDLGYGLTLATSLTYTWGKEKISAAPDQPLTRIPPLYGQLALRYARDQVGGKGRLFIEGYLRGATDQERLSAEDEADARIPAGGTPGWLTYNARVGYLTGQVAVSLVVENLTNEAYKYHGSGIYAPGTNAMLSLETFR